MPLVESSKRLPLTWYRFGDGAVRVVCSKGHASIVQHIIQPDGTLVAPPGKSSSLKCGWCHEDLPLKLEGWKP